MSFVLHQPISAGTFADPGSSYRKLLCGFDGGLTDESGEGHTLSAVGTAGLSSTQVFSGSGAIYVPGNNAHYVSAGSHADWAFGTGDFALEFAYRPDSISTRVYILGNVNGANDTSWVMVQYNGGGLGFGTGLTNPAYVSSGVLTAGQWHLIGAFRVGGIMGLTCNRQVIAMGTSTENLSTTAELRIGTAGTYGASIGLNAAAGYIDELVIHKGAGFAAPATTTKWDRP